MASSVDHKTSAEQIMARIEAIDSEAAFIEAQLKEPSERSFSKPLYREPKDLPFFEEANARHVAQRPRFLRRMIARMTERNRELAAAKAKFVVLQRAWEKKIRRIEAMSDEHETVPSISAPIMASAHQAIPSTAVAAGAAQQFAGRAGGRRGTMGDAVRSEEELNQIMLELLEQERENPATRWMSTAAATPPMILADPKMPSELPRFINTTERLVDLSSAALREPHDHHCVWSEAETRIFVDKYLLHRKNFARIAAHLPYKTTADCIRFYYHNKRRLRLKQLVANYRRGAINEIVKAKPPKKGADLNYSEPSYRQVGRPPKKSRVGRPPKSSFVNTTNSGPESPEQLANDPASHHMSISELLN